MAMREKPREKDDQMKLQAKVIFLNAGKYLRDVQVVGIYMYLRDGYFYQVLSAYEEKPRFPIYLYDIVLSDRYNGTLMKCFLAPKMYITVQTGKLRIGATIRIKNACIRGIRVVLKDFDITGIKDITDTSNMSYLPHFDNREILPQPLFAMRSYYLCPFLQDVPYGNKWTNVAHSLTSSTQFNRYFCMTLKQMERYVRKKKGNRKLSYPDLIVLVLQRGRFDHYGKPWKSKACPFKGHLLLGDRSAICGAVLWDERNCGAHWHVKPGDTILLRNYTTSVNYMYKRYRHRFEYPDILALEISLNCKSDIHLVNDSDIPAGPRRIRHPLTVPEYRFVARNLLGSINHGEKVDVVGYVTYVGHCIRVNIPDSKCDGQQWVVYRWIEMLDDTSKFPIRIKLHLNYQLSEQIITPGELLLCTYLRVIQQSMKSSFGKVHFFLKSTNESWITSELPKHVMRENRIQEFLKWMKMSYDYLKHIEILVCRVGGFSRCKFADETMDMAMPRLKPSIRKPVKCNSAFLLGTHWKDELDKLEVRECKSVIIHGSVTQVTYIHVECKRITREHLYICTLSANDCALSSEHWQLAFPRMHLLDFKEELKKFLEVPPFSSEQVRTLPLTEEQLEELPFFSSRGYIIVIRSDNHPISISTVFLPSASKYPHPSLEDLLKKKYHMKELFLDEECYIETATSILEQNERLRETAKEIECKKFFFKVDFYCYEANKTLAILNRVLKKGHVGLHVPRQK